MNPCWDDFFTPERCCGGSVKADSTRTGSAVIDALREELFTDVDPYGLLDHPCGKPYVPQHRYEDSHLTAEIVRTVMAWVGEASLWLEVGSFVGNSAITTAQTLKELGLTTGVVCIDPFTGVVDMWATRKALRTVLRLREQRSLSDGLLVMDEFGHSRIYEMFLANVRGSGHQDVVMPIRISSISGMRLLRDLHRDGRLTLLPQVIYLDSAHEPNETLLEVREAWKTLQAPGILFGDDWSWPGVRQDVTIFAEELRNPILDQQTLRRFDWPSQAAHQPVPGLAVVDEGDGAWFLLKDVE